MKHTYKIGDTVRVLSGAMNDPIDIGDELTIKALYTEDNGEGEPCYYILNATDGFFFEGELELVKPEPQATVYTIPPHLTGHAKIDWIKGCCDVGWEMTCSDPNGAPRLRHVESGKYGWAYGGHDSWGGADVSGRSSEQWNGTITVTKTVEAKQTKHFHYGSLDVALYPDFAEIGEHEMRWDAFMQMCRDGLDYYDEN